MWNVYDIEQSTMEPISKMKNKCFEPIFSNIKQIAGMNLKTGEINL